MKQRADDFDKMNRAMFYDMQIRTLVENDTTHIIQMQNDGGDGLMSFYTVFPGIFLLFSDFHMKECLSQFPTGQDMFCIDHCREGRIEQEISNGAYLYLNAGDIFFDIRKSGGRHVEFPSEHYHGVSISFVLGTAEKGLKSCIADFPIDIDTLRRKYCDRQINMVLQEESGLKRIFADLYAVPSDIRLPWFRVKIQELLLYLYALELPEEPEERPYFFKDHVEKAKAIHALMTENLSEHFTLEELSKRFDFPMTAMKKSFKNIYGDSIFSYMRSYRINQAAVLLRRERDKSVLEIASLMGYESPGKFSTAFKAIMGCSPLAYRKKSVELDKNHLFR